MSNNTKDIIIGLLVILLILGVVAAGISVMYLQIESNHFYFERRISSVVELLDGFDSCEVVSSAQTSMDEYSRAVVVLSCK